MTPVFALAFDHRNSFRRGFMQLAADPTPEQLGRMVAAKGVVVDALLRAAAQVRGGRPALLIDAEYGGRYVDAARSGGVAVAMPVEVSGRRELSFEYEGDFATVIEAYQPDFAKVLVRYNPDGDREMNARQRQRLRALVRWLDGRPQQLMLELLVPPEKEQLTAVGGDRLRYDRELRAELTARAVVEIAGDGVRPPLWKIEGPETAADARLVAAAVRDVRQDSGCLVLGRGADPAAVRRWLATAAGVTGFCGFAVGRTLWWDPLRDVMAGGDRDAAVQAIADHYLDLVRTYAAVIPAG
ncbi:MAG: 2-deoxy-5-keto-D-gluconate 6-phosphate aldolase domain-containing protein [Nocardioidaceae bacterium]